MIDLGDAPVRAGLRAALERSWAELARCGGWWTAKEKLAIATVARDAKQAIGASNETLPAAAIEVAVRIAGEPATASEAWVTSMTETLGLERYVEAVSVTARVAAIDTFTRLVGLPKPPFPEAQPGEPRREAAPDGLRRNHTWVPMSMPVPQMALGSVPSASAAVNDLVDNLYMSMTEMGDASWRRGPLDRPMVELVATVVSHSNECFY